MSVQRITRIEVTYGNGEMAVWLPEGGGPGSNWQAWNTTADVLAVLDPPPTIEGFEVKWGPVRHRYAVATCPNDECDWKLSGVEFHIRHECAMHATLHAPKQTPLERLAEAVAADRWPDIVYAARVVVAEREADR